MNILKKAVAGALLTAVSVTGAWADSSDPIRIPVNEWTGQHISAHITGTLLQKAGYTVAHLLARSEPVERGCEASSQAVCQAGAGLHREDVVEHLPSYDDLPAWSPGRSTALSRVCENVRASQSTVRR